jgi:hypothetical protein
VSSTLSVRTSACLSRHRREAAAEPRRRSLRLSSWPILLITSALALLVSLAASARIVQTQASQDRDWRYRIGAVETIGLKRLTQAQMLAIAGLQVGRTVGRDDMEGAQQRLLKSGLFVEVRCDYGFRNPGYRFIVTFTVEEAAWQTPVVFDNFVDHSDAQLISGVARDLPTFAGLTPDHEAVLTRIAGAVERLSRESKDPGTVRYVLIYDATQGVRHWRFHLDRLSGPLPICTVDVSGITTALQESIRNKRLSLLDMDYSRDFVANHAEENLVPVLGAHGLIRARVTGVGVRREPERPGCERGASRGGLICAARALVNQLEQRW